MSILKHRKAIDELDEKIVKLLNERTQHVLAIGDLKVAKGEEIYAPHREQLVFQKVCRINQGPVEDDSLKAIYREIMSSALSLQRTKTIAYFGPEATFTHQAAIQRFGSSLKYSPQKTIPDVFTEVSKHRADYGVVPIENSTEGVVTHTLDMFVDSELKIVSQIVMPIRHCLASHCAFKAIRALYSHPQALAQCREWLRLHMPNVELIEASSTARAAEMAAQDKTTAAIVSSLAAAKYNLPLVEANIQDSSQNATRFLVLGRQCGKSTGNDRTSLMFSAADKAGSLYNSLAPFRKYKLNMTKIESRPSRRKAWEYFFFVDCDGHFEDPLVAKALIELDKHCYFVKILGSYPNIE
jgi:chorismate mutase/prephenate dehydratase